MVPGISNYYPDLGMIGKHFLVYTPNYKVDNKLVCRHYTIANCMNKDFYDSISGGKIPQSLLN
jgi:hypothetical protein